MQQEVRTSHSSLRSRPNPPTAAADYNNLLSNRFSTANLAGLGRRLKLDEILIFGGGTTHVSHNMVAQALNALFGGVKLSVRSLVPSFSSGADRSLLKGGQAALEKVLLSLEIM